MATATFVAIGAIFVLLLLSAFFSGSETALTAASHARLHRLEDDGDSRAAVVNRLREKKERLIGAILLGNNLVNILASALATSVLIGLFGQTGVVYATIAMTILILIFAEVLPKSYALHHAVGVARVVGPAMRPVVYVLAPITNAMMAVVTATLRLIGLRIQAELDISKSEEELRGAIDLHAGPEPEIEHEKAMLQSVLDLTDVEVGEIMTHRRNITMIDADLPPREIVERVLASPFTRIPLYRDKPDNVVGVLHAKALLRAVQNQEADIDTLNIPDIATKPWFIPESTDLLQQLQIFRERQEHFALVVDEYGTLMGIVTLEDILEEIVGDISDEVDIEIPGVRPQADGSFIVKGDVTIRDLNRELGWRLPDEEAATIAGLVMHEARLIPEVGQVYRFYGFRFEILRRQRNQIISIRIVPGGREDQAATA